MQRNRFLIAFAWIPGAALAAVAVAQAQTQASTVTRSSGPTRTAMDEVRPFYSWVEDATLADGLRMEPVMTWGDFGHGNEFTLGLQAGGEVVTGLEVGGDLHFISLDPDVGDGETGVSDLGLYGRYSVYDQEFRIFLGGGLDLPIGSEKVGASTFDFKIFGAGRYTLQNDMVIFTNIGIESLEIPSAPANTDSRENGLLLGGGVLWPATTELGIIGELDIRANNYAIFGGGVDYTLLGGGHLRAGIGLGLDDRAPDLQLNLSFATLLGGSGR
jgi:hypothetical protein